MKRFALNESLNLNERSFNICYHLTTLSVLFSCDFCSLIAGFPASQLNNYDVEKHCRIADLLLGLSHDITVDFNTISSPPLHKSWIKKIARLESKHLNHFSKKSKLFLRRRKLLSSSK